MQFRISLFILLLCIGYMSHAQVIIYTDVFTNGVTATPAQVTAWNNFRASLLALPYYKVKVTGSVGPTVKECLNPTIVQDIALKLRTLPGPVATNAYSWIDGPNTWQIGTDINGRFGVNMTSLSNCDNPGHVIKPGIANSNWGGWGTATCGGPTQTITIEFWYGPPCPIATNLNATAITGKTATVSWDPVAGSTGYEYAVTTSATPPVSGTSTTLTTENVGSLTPSTTYYLHVRNICSSTSASQWNTYIFKTLPPCYPPVGFVVTNLSTSSATIGWSPWPSALNYDYVFNLDRNDPLPTAVFNTTSATAFLQGGLTENTWYYVHIRSNCAAGEISVWSLDSFLTPILCKAPVVKIDHVNTDEAVAFWDTVNTGRAYEYAITTSPAPPALGTKYKFTSLHLPALYDGKEYFIHVRSHCNSLGIDGISDWGTASFKTFPVSVNEIDRTELNIAVFPNPTQGNISISISNINRESRIEVADISGRVLMQERLFDKTSVVNTAQLSPGIYLLKYTDGIHSQVLRFVKE